MAESSNSLKLIARNWLFNLEASSFFFFVVMGIGPRGLCMPGKYSTHSLSHALSPRGLFTHVWLLMAAGCPKLLHGCSGLTGECLSHLSRAVYGFLQGIPPRLPRPKGRARKPQLFGRSVTFTRKSMWYQGQSFTPVIPATREAEIGL